MTVRSPSSVCVKSHPDSVYDGNLACPNCGSEYLHHVAVTVRNRIEEDEPGVRVDVKGQFATIAAQKDEDFAARRDDVSISFWCEECIAGGSSEAPGFMLWIVQHKGTTLVRWGRPGESFNSPW